MSSRFKPYLTVALMIEHEGRFLVVEEKDEYDNLVFGFPAGHVDAKESIVQAAIREGFEETGRQVELDHLVGIYDYVKDDETILRFLFKAHFKDAHDLMSLTPADPDGDILAIKWYSKDEMLDQKDSWRTRLIGYNLVDYLNGKSISLSHLTTVVP